MEDHGSSVAKADSGDAKSQLVGESPFRDAPLAPVSAEVEMWARALCSAWGNKPDKLIGFPATPAWRSCVHYAEVAIKAHAAIAKATGEQA